jgi:hypothetical protein
MPINHVRTSLWVCRTTFRLLRILAAHTKETMGELVDRLVADEAFRLNVQLIMPDPVVLRSHRRASAGSDRPRNPNEIWIEPDEEEVLMGE